MNSLTATILRLVLLYAVVVNYPEIKSHLENFAPPAIEKVDSNSQLVTKLIGDLGLEIARSARAERDSEALVELGWEYGLQVWNDLDLSSMVSGSLEVESVEKYFEKNPKG